MSRIRALILLFVLLAAGVVSVMWSRRLAGQKSGVPMPDVVRQVMAIEAWEKEMDRAVWAAEMAAEPYGDAVVRWWDDLRRATNKFDVIKQLMVERIEFPQVSVWNKVAPGIEMAQFAKNPNLLGAIEWKKFLQQLQSDGFSLEQSDWRHAGFEPASAAGGAKSIVVVTLNLANQSREERWAVRSNLQIEWASLRDSGGTPIPRSIQAKDVELL